MSAHSFSDPVVVHPSERSSPGVENGRRIPWLTFMSRCRDERAGERPRTRFATEYSKPSARDFFGYTPFHALSWTRIERNRLHSAGMQEGHRARERELGADVDSARKRLSDAHVKRAVNFPREFTEVMANVASYFHSSSVPTSQD